MANLHGTPSPIADSQRRQAREQMRGATFSDVLDAYLNRPGTKPKSWAQTVACLCRERMMEGAAHDLAGRVFADLKRKDFVEVKNRIAARSENSCRQFFAHLSGLMKWAAEREMISRHPLTDIRLPAPPKAWERILDDTEIATSWQATEVLGHPFNVSNR